MVAKTSRDRRTSSSTSPSTKRRTSTTHHEKKKIIKPMGICSFCLGDENKNAQGIPEDMIDCAECGNCGHPSCLKYSAKLVAKIKTTRWQCLDCKKCVICNIGDESLLFCDYCDAAIHPKCCNPPLHHIPKGDFACPACRDDGTAKSSPNRKKSETKTPTRSLRSKTVSEEKLSPVLTRPVAQLIDGMSNFFLPNKDKLNNNTNNNNKRQQSVQKAMKFLRNKNSKNKNQLIARSILASSKTPRVRRKPVTLTDEPATAVLSSEHTTNVRRSMTKTPTRRSDEELPTKKKRKHSISSITQTPVNVKKKLKRKESKTEDEQEEEEQEEEEEEEAEKPKIEKRKLNLDLSKYQTPPSFLQDSLPDTIAANDVYLFLDARKNSAKLISDCSEKFQHLTEPIEGDANNPRWPPYIVFGDDLMKTWYSSSYPQEYARVPRLFICEFCLKYMKCEQVYDRHRKQCKTFHPPANEIYHKDDLSVFEVDGNINRIYCQNLCLLAKLFLDHKTLYYDVEPFLFYVLTRNDSTGCHFLGYFSKEKHCPQKYNLSCIMVLPHCQRRGYGRFLIELSYLLSQKESQIGTPERPLSVHGAHTYEAYWKIKIIEQLLKYHQIKKDSCVLKDIMNETGMNIEDIVDTFQNLGVLTMKSNKKPVIHVDLEQIKTMMKTERIKHANWVSLDSEFLRFTPVLKPILLITDGTAVEQQTKEIQVVFRRIESEQAESTGNQHEGEGEGEVVRLIRRRKFGRKRRSYFVKYRVSNNKIEPQVSTQHDDEQSQEYSERRRDSTVDESDHKDEQEEEEREEEVVKTQPTSPVNSPANQPKFKQLTLDSFLKKAPPKPPSPVPEVEEKVSEITMKESDPIPEQPTPDIVIEEPRLPRRIKRLSNTHVSKSETDLSKIANGTTDEPTNKSTLREPKSIARQISDGTVSSNDNSPAPVNSPLPFKKRAWASTNVQALLDPPSVNSKTERIFSRETSITTPSSLSDILNNPLMASSSSINSTDDETKIARIESQLKTTIEAVEEVDASDDQPPSLTSPTSMIVSQSNHYNYPTRNTIAKQQQLEQQQSITINNFSNSTTMTYNYAQTPYGYPYVPPPTMDIPPYYYPPMNYMPYYPTATPPLYPTAQQMCYPPNGVNTLPYPPGNGTSPYGYPTAQSSSSSNRRH